MNNIVRTTAALCVVLTACVGQPIPLGGVPQDGAPASPSDLAAPGSDMAVPSQNWWIDADLGGQHLHYECMFSNGGSGGSISGPSDNGGAGPSFGTGDDGPACTPWAGPLPRLSLTVWLRGFLPSGPAVGTFDLAHPDTTCKLRVGFQASSQAQQNPHPGPDLAMIGGPPTPYADYDSTADGPAPGCTGTQHAESPAARGTVTVTKVDGRYQVTLANVVLAGSGQPANQWPSQVTINSARLVW